MRSGRLDGDPAVLAGHYWHLPARSVAATLAAATLVVRRGQCRVGTGSDRRQCGFDASAQEEGRADHEDRNEGEDESVLDEPLPSLTTRRRPVTLVASIAGS